MLVAADGHLLFTGGVITSPQEVERLHELASQLRAEYGKLLEACSGDIAPETKKLIFNAINLSGSGYTGQGHSYQCPRCSSVYVVGAPHSLSI